jgi:hypothetical protein
VLAAAGLLTAPPRRPLPALLRPAELLEALLLLRPRLLAAVATGRRLGVTALERRVVLLRLRLALLLAGRALLGAAALVAAVAGTGLAELAGAATGAALALLAGVEVLGVEPAGVLELAIAREKGRETVELIGAGRSVSHRAPRNR